MRKVSSRIQSQTYNFMFFKYSPSPYLTASGNFSAECAIKLLYKRIWSRLVKTLGDFPTQAMTYSATQLRISMLPLPAPKRKGKSSVGQEKGEKKGGMGVGNVNTCTPSQAQLSHTHTRDKTHGKAQMQQCLEM